MPKYRPTSGLVEIQFELRGAEDPLTVHNTDRGTLTITITRDGKSRTYTMNSNPYRVGRCHSIANHLTKTRNDTHYAQYSSPQLIGWYSWATL